MTEQDLQKKIMRYIQACGGYVIKVITASKAGVHDIIACHNGKFYSIEVKIGYNKPSELQLANAKLVKKAGGIAIIAYKLEDVMKEIEYEVGNTFSSDDPINE